MRVRVAVMVIVRREDAWGSACEAGGHECRSMQEAQHLGEVNMR